MSNDIAIRVSNLSKLYHLGEHAARAPYKTLRDSLAGLFRRTPTARSLTESTEITKVKSHSSADTDGRTASAAGNAGTPVKPSPSPTSVLPVSPVRDNSDLLWALKNVNFTINRGEVVGIIGRNGAGKSTLLKILSRITDPTEDTAELHRRENIFLSVALG
jgi:ABC-type multidrug transport system fused ATPase/permease subunit